MIVAWKPALALALAGCIAAPASAAPLRFDEVAALAIASARTTFGDMRVDTYIPNALLSDTIGEFIGIPTSYVAPLSGPFVMISGCRPQSCDEKAAVIVDRRTRRIAALALRDFRCRNVVGKESRKPTADCDAEPTLDVFIVRRSGSVAALRQEREQLASLRAWGKHVGHAGEHVQTIMRTPGR